LPSGRRGLKGGGRGELRPTVSQPGQLSACAKTGRVVVDGKHLACDGRPFRIRGVTYGAFAARSDGELFPETAAVERDFRQVADAGLNAVRTYNVPPKDVLDLARDFGLRLVVGLHYEDWRYALVPGRVARRRVREAGLRAVAEAMERCAGRSHVLAISVGNEVPGDVVRVHGRRAVEDTLSAFVEAVHDADSQLLATYTSFPTTEYLEVAGQDLVSFNVFLEDPQRLRSYLRRLQILAGERPLLVSELGLAAGIHGEELQAKSLAWQLREVEEAGCAGATVFSWTDEWAVGGHDVDGWGFGVTDAARRPKPALDVVGDWAAATVRDLREEWPQISVIVCAHNAEASIEECLASLERADYPELEVIVCDDGSSDATLAVAGRFPFRVLELPRIGLSAARNAGIAAASGEIIAFLDADAVCHPHWPYYLALSLEEENVVATGGPNLPFRSAPLVERAVAASPGGPVEVLLSDDRAEHVPGCNMAYRKDALRAVGGFDPIFTAAGDDVDVCWKLLDHGWAIGFSPAAQVLHHRRDSVRGFLRQQRGYGRAERLLAGRHRHRFNRLGQARWIGFVYGRVRLFGSLLRGVVYHGSMGSAAFQPVIARRSERLLAVLTAHLPVTVPVALLGLLGPLSAWWLAAPALAVGAVLAYATAVAVAARPGRNDPQPFRFRVLLALLHVVQPIARAWGRIRGPRAEPLEDASPEWVGDRFAWLAALRRELLSRGCHVRDGGAHDEWDLQASIGPFLRSRVATAVVWRSQPLHRVSLGLRFWLVGGIGFSLLALSFSTLAGAVSLAAVLALSFLEGALLARRTKQALAATSSAEQAEAPSQALIVDLHARLPGSSGRGAEPVPEARPAWYLESSGRRQEGS
jgi:glycosyltransferase involved in cell wall biosynthesis